nr:hypothetical protein CFP56_33721 [Quercus suber]
MVVNTSESVDSHRATSSPPPIPPRPTNQRMATTPQQPPEETVQAMMELGLPRDQCIRYLKAKKNDIAAATAALFDGEDISAIEQSQTWDDSMFSSGDRYGNHDADQNLRPLGTTAPNTREPSPGRGTLHPVSKEQEDADLMAALAASQGDLNTFQQESGIVRRDGTEAQFGPATKAHYDSSQWAMVRTSQEALSEVIPDVDVEGRKAVLGEPRMLKQVPGGDYMANLITIMHGIPLARETMLMREFVRPSYGHDPDWWKGHSISMPKIVHVDDGTPTETLEVYDDFLAEVQRLMAALDSSSRAYVSPGALTQTDAIKNHSPENTRSKTLLELFLCQYHLAMNSKLKTYYQAKHLFTSIIPSSELKDDIPEHPVFDLPVTATSDEPAELYELLDDLLWKGDTSDMETPSRYVESAADVLVMHLHNHTADRLGASIPATLYMDRYQKEQTNATVGIRKEIAKGKERVRKIGDVEKMLTAWKHPQKNEAVDARAMLKHTHAHFSGRREADAQSNGIPTSDKELPSPPHHGEVAQQLADVMESIDAKLAALSSEKERIRKLLGEMTKSPLPGTPVENLKHRYHLVGLATKPNITYLLRPVEEDEDDLDGMRDEQDSTPAGMQWWRLEYQVHPHASALGSARLARTKAPDYDVLRAVELEHHAALLVYASDLAMDPRQLDDLLPSPLEEFLDTDDALYREEREAALRDPPTYAHHAFNFTVDGEADGAGAQHVRESIERRGSMDSTRAARGPSPPLYEDDVFEAHHGYGLPPEGQAGAYGAALEQQQQPPPPESEVVEIRLDDHEAGARDVEMVEKADGAAGDAMEDSQDLGVGKVPDHTPSSRIPTSAAAAHLCPGQMGNGQM